MELSAENKGPPICSFRPSTVAELPSIPEPHASYALLTATAGVQAWRIDSDGPYRNVRSTDMSVRWPLVHGHPRED